MSDIGKTGEKEGQDGSPTALAFALGEIKGTVENLRTDIKEWKTETGTKTGDLETRMRALEKWKWMVAGAAAAGGLAGQQVISAIARVTGHG